MKPEHQLVGRYKKPTPMMAFLMPIIMRSLSSLPWTAETGQMLLLTAAAHMKVAKMSSMEILEWASDAIDSAEAFVAWRTEAESKEQSRDNDVQE